MTTIAKDEISQNSKFSLSATDIKMLEKDRAKHIKGKSKSYSWQEAKEIIRGKNLYR